MTEEITALRKVTCSPDWPDRWMTAAQMEAEMERRGLWQQPPFDRYTGRDRLNFLTAALQGDNGKGDQCWVSMGSEYKACDRINENDRRRVIGWCWELNARISHDFECYRLGMPKPEKERPNAGALTHQEIVSQIAPLVRKLFSLARRLGWPFIDLLQLSFWSKANNPPEEVVHDYYWMAKMILTFLCWDIGKGCLRPEALPREARRVQGLINKIADLYDLRPYDMDQAGESADSDPEE
jgi:hypothetical protein